MNKERIMGQKENLSKIMEQCETNYKELQIEMDKTKKEVEDYKVK